MSESAKAIFLGYASQDADAARRICDALRPAGLEVWFDQSELPGGDAWDAAIRKQVKECALFAPLKRYVQIGEGTHTIIMENNRMQLFRAVKQFLDEKGQTSQ